MLNFTGGIAGAIASRVNYKEFLVVGIFPDGEISVISQHDNRWDATDEADMQRRRARDSKPSPNVFKEVQVLASEHTVASYDSGHHDHDHVRDWTEDATVVERAPVF